MRFEDIIKELQSICLSNREKASIRASLKDAIRTSVPVRVGLWQSLIWWSQQYKHYQLNYRFMPILIVLALILGGGGMSYAAEGTVPGDILYSVKVNITEPVRGFVAFSDEAKVSWDAERVNRRFSEAEELAAEKGLSAEARATLQGHFKNHADKAQSRIKNIASDNPEKAVELSSDLEATIKAHARILGSIGISLDGDTNTNIKLFLKDVDKEESDTREENENARDAILSERFTTTASAAEGKRKAAENKLAEVSAFVKAWENKNGTTTTATANIRLQSAQKVFAEGDVELKAQSYEKAFLLFQKAHSMAQEVKLLLDAKVRFEKDDDRDDGGGQDFNATSSSDRVKTRSNDDDERKKDKQSQETKSNQDNDSSDDEDTVDIEIKGRVEEDTENQSSSIEGSGKIKIDLDDLDF